ncbi:hypothetical protein TWF506_005894 [Arthrobotrys conoides]|uniref:Uncharacterized protein n=1 Tax=Arthrobotrys conoides TaxID=74498 RepID=A0AAN8RWA2_9PEZI
MSRPSGTGFLHPLSFTIFFYIFFIFNFYSRTVPAAPILQDIHINRRDTNISIQCTKSTASSTASISITTNIKTIIETTFTTQTDVITRTITGGDIGGSSSTSTGFVVETTSTLTTVQSGSPVVSEIGTEPGYVFTTPESTTSGSSTIPLSSSSSLSRPAITMIASPPVAVIPTNEPVERPVPTSEVLITTTSSIESDSSSATALPISTESTESGSTTLAESTTTSPSISTSILTTTTSPSEEPTSMVSNIIIPIETPQPSLDSEITSLEIPSLITTLTTPRPPTLATTFQTIPTSSISSSESSIDPPKTGYILTGIVLPEPSDIPAAQSTRIQLDGGVSMPTSTGGADLNGPPELVFRGDAGRSVSIRIGVWGVSGVVAMVLGVVV